MKKIVLLVALTFGALQANSVVHYDVQNAKDTKSSKPNYPNDDIYPSK